MLSKEEIERYSRQINLPEFGREAQQKLKQASVLVVGAGALGCPVLTYLSIAGIGKIGIVDGDKIELSNLHRQPLYGVADLGQSKAQAAKRVLCDKNPEIEINAYEAFITATNAFSLIESYDIVVDGTDNFPTRYLLNDACVLKGKTNVHASILRFNGQISVFNALLENGERGPNYRDLYPEPPTPGEVPDCATGGVIGVLPGIIGNIQAMEVIKLVTGIGKPLTGQLFLFDSLTFSHQILTFEKDANNPLTGVNPTQHELIDYAEFCGTKKNDTMNTLTVSELKEMMDNQEDFQLIDVREPYEYEVSNLGGLLIPLNEVPVRHEEISKDKKVVVHCRSGVRSANAISFLKQSFGYTNLYNLDGGIMAWAREIDDSLEVH